MIGATFGKRPSLKKEMAITYSVYKSELRLYGETRLSSSLVTQKANKDCEMTALANRN